MERRHYPYYFCPTCLGRQFKTRVDTRYDMTGFLTVSGKVSKVAFDGTEVQKRASRRSYVTYPEPPICTNCNNPVPRRRPSNCFAFDTMVEDAYRIAPDSTLQALLIVDLTEYEKQIIEKVQCWRKGFRNKHAKTSLAALKRATLQTDTSEEERQMFVMMIKEWSEKGKEKKKKKKK